MKESKKALRKRLSGSAPDGRTMEETGFAEQIERLPEFAAARTVALYCSLPDEIPTGGMLRRWNGSKRLVLPVVTHSGEMVFREYTGEDGLVPGAFGIREPAVGSEISPEEIDLMIVPGVAFDRQGHRLGRGRSFYDRYLSRPGTAHIHKVGLCRPGTLVTEVPVEPHDIAMDTVITGL